MNTFDRNSEACLKLLQFVSNELFRDGGTTLAPWLKEYARYPKRIDTLLLATVKSKRLLTFIESFPDVFYVSRDKDPHTVSLRTLEFCDENCSLVEAGTANAVREKALYALRRRESRISRRQTSKAHDKVDHQASLTWLLSQCSMELHKHLRSLLFYPAVYKTKEMLGQNDLPEYCRVGEKAWMDLVLPSFRELLGDFSELQLSETKVAIATAPHSGISNISDDEVEALASLLKDTIVKDGATQVCLSLLLSRYEDVRKLLAGRDMMDFVESKAKAFQGISIWKNDIGDIVLRLTENHTCTNGRMQVDEVGLFSVASGRWGAAISSVLAHEAETFFNIKASEITAVDLTASVGGITLTLSKRFRLVLAIEIDATRAELCRQNMKQHCRENVTVLNLDAMEALENLDVHTVAVIIDPPWGGHEYRRLKKPIRMGHWSLEDVIIKVGRKLSPVVIALRLPINFCCATLEQSLTDKRVRYETRVRRKLGQQMLLVIAIS